MFKGAEFFCKALNEKIMNMKTLQHFSHHSLCFQVPSNLTAKSMESERKIRTLGNKIQRNRYITKNTVFQINIFFTTMIMGLRTTVWHQSHKTLYCIMGLVLGLKDIRSLQKESSEQTQTWILTLLRAALYRLASDENRLHIKSKVTPTTNTNSLRYWFTQVSSL